VLLQQGEGLLPHLVGLARRLLPAEVALGCPRLAERFALAPQGPAHVAAGHGLEELLPRGQAGAERRRAVAVEQPGGIRTPAGLADAALAEVGINPDVQPETVRLVHDRHAVVGLLAWQWIHSPAGPPLGGGAARGHQAQDSQAPGREAPEVMEAKNQEHAGNAPDVAGNASAAMQCRPPARHTRPCCSGAMALTASQMVPLGTALPREALLPDLQPGPLLVLFICTHCPFVKHVEAEIGRLERDFPALQLLAIASNSTLTHPQDGPEGLRAQAQTQGWGFPYLFDADQQLAKAFTAACTPDPFLYAWDGLRQQHRLVYRGQLDASRPGNALPCDGSDIRAAIAAVLAHQPVPADQRPAIGCNIKWRPGEEPEWAR